MCVKKGYSGPYCETSSDTAGIDITVIDTTFERIGRRGGGGGRRFGRNSDSYSCIDNKCVKKSDGVYTSLSNCSANCGVTPPPPPPADKYTCNDQFKCVVDAQGKYTSLSNCSDNCKAPPPPPPPPADKYTCNDQI